MNEIEKSLLFIRSKAIREELVLSEIDVKHFIKTSTIKEWLYFIQFNSKIFAWGTASGNGSRIRKSSLFNPKLTGKYDRRGEYLMLMAAFGKPSVYLFEVAKAVLIEQQLLSEIYHDSKRTACFYGFNNRDRNSIVYEIVEIFKRTEKFKKLNMREKELFDDFIHNFYLAKLRHPKRNAKFLYGDCLEPKFLDITLGRQDLIPVIEKALSVHFY